MASREPKIALDEVEAEYRRLCGERAQTKYITLRDMAAMMGIDSSSLRKYAAKRGFKTVKMQYGKGPQPWQMAVAITSADAKRLLRLRKKEGLIPGSVIHREGNQRGKGK